MRLSLRAIANAQGDAVAAFVIDSANLQTAAKTFELGKKIFRFDTFDVGSCGIPEIIIDDR